MSAYDIMADLALRGLTIGYGKIKRCKCTHSNNIELPETTDCSGRIVMFISCHGNNSIILLKGINGDVPVGCMPRGITIQHLSPQEANEMANFDALGGSNGKE